MTRASLVSLLRLALVPVFGFRLAAEGQRMGRPIQGVRGRPADRSAAR